jgi:lantibiotic modifying enzyme
MTCASTGTISSLTADSALRVSRPSVGGGRRFNLGLFRGIAGVGYTLLRRVDGSLPNLLLWE